MFRWMIIIIIVLLMLLGIHAVQSTVTITDKTGGQEGLLKPRGGKYGG